MDLLNQNQYEKPEQPKGKKVVAMLLVISIIAAIAIIIAMLLVSSNKEVETTLYINGQPTQITTELIISDTQGNQYISLRELTQLLGYEYYNSEYNNYGTSIDKCYIKNKNLITGFEVGTNKIYKYEEGTLLDFQYYDLNRNIVKYNDKLYIAFADLREALNASCSINENKQIIINSMEHLSTLYQTNLTAKGLTVAADQNNKKALAYGWIIVNRNGVWSALNPAFEEVIGAQYSSIYFDEYNQDFILANTSGQYGIIDNRGVVKVPIIYDGLEILNYENMLYKVKYKNKYGIMNSEGKMLTEIVYDEIGYQANPASKILYTLIIPEVDGKSGPLVVVKQNNFYGLIRLETGETFLPCDHVEKLYSISELEGIEYMMEAEGITMNLLEYLQLRGVQIVE